MDSSNWLSNGATRPWIRGLHVCVNACWLPPKCRVSLPVLVKLSLGDIYQAKPPISIRCHLSNVTRHMNFPQETLTCNLAQFCISLQPGDAIRNATTHRLWALGQTSARLPKDVVGILSLPCVVLKGDVEQLYRDTCWQASIRQDRKQHAVNSPLSYRC